MNSTRRLLPAAVVVNAANNQLSGTLPLSLARSAMFQSGEYYHVPAYYSLNLLNNQLNGEIPAFFLEGHKPSFLEIILRVRNFFRYLLRQRFMSFQRKTRVQRKVSFSVDVYTGCPVHNIPSTVDGIPVISTGPHTVRTPPKPTSRYTAEMILGKWKKGLICVYGLIRIAPANNAIVISN